MRSRFAFGEKKKPIVFDEGIDVGQIWNKKPGAVWKGAIGNLHHRVLVSDVYTNEYGRGVHFTDTDGQIVMSYLNGCSVEDFIAMYDLEKQ